MTTRLFVIAAAVAAFVSLSTAPAEAAPSEEIVKQAQEYFEKGDTAYNLGRYDEAVEWFTKAYETWPLPDFLYNIAQSHRLDGNCKQALHFYKRYKALKEKDKEAPLTKKEKAEIEKFITELTDCAAKADESATTTPDTVKQPDTTTTKTKPDTTTTKTKPDTTTTTTTKPDTTTTTKPDTTTTTTKTEPDVAVVEEEEEEEEEYEDDLLVETGIQAPRMLSARASFGVGIFGGGDLKIPAQPAFNLGAGYPIPAGPVIVDAGLGLSFSAIPYEFDMMGSTKSATLLGVRATGGATYPINEQMGVRGELGLGLSSLSGLQEGNPFTEDRSAGGATMFSLRLGAAFEYGITPNVAAVVPVSFSFSPAASDLYLSSLTELTLSVGVGYRM